MIQTRRIPAADRICAARSGIDPVFLHTPLIRQDELDRATGCRLWAKVECLNPIRSFKGRGTDWFVRSLPGRTAGPQSGLVAASAGNFGQGLAYAAVQRGIAVTIFAAITANPLKIAAMRRLGAEVMLAGADFDAAKAAARAYAARTGALFVEDGDAPEIAEGAGTIAAEITEAGLMPDVMLVPLGNGALLTGVGCWMRAAAPGCKVIGVVARGAPAMQASFLAGRVVQTVSAATIADGIAVRDPVPYAVETMAGVVDEVVAVSEDALRRAMRLTVETLGLAVEPAGVAGLAAVLADRERFQGRTVATILCGGNIAADLLVDLMSA